jgi:hypothetical protein
MFRLVRLAIYGLLGYAMFEFVRGFVAGGSCCGGGAEAKQRGSGDLNRALDEDSGRSNLTGPGGGERVVTDEPDGRSESHVVGRGVVPT